MSDFAWVPDYTVVTNSEWKTLVSEMENGVKQYRQKRPTQIQTWKLTFKNRTTAVAQAVLAFFNTKYGRATSFSWTSPLDSVEYTVRFNQDSFSYDYVSYGICDFSVDFEQDIA